MHIRSSAVAFILTLASACAVMLPSSASAAGVGYLSGAKINSETAAEIGLGYAFNISKGYVAPIIGAEFTRGDADSRYYTQTQSNGTDVCRDRTNGQYSKKENCSANTNTRAFAALEAGVRLAETASLGVGVRRGEVTSPYAVLNIGAFSGGKVRVAGGKSYASIGVSGGF